MFNLNKSMLGLCVAGASLASSAVVFSANPAQAAIFNVGGTDYDITTVTGTYDDNAAVIQASPWWGNSSLAENLASTVSGTLGFPNYDEGTGGPFFAYEGGSNGIYSRYNYYMLPGSSSFVATSQDYARTYAVSSTASAVPEPLTILGSITAAGFGVAFKRKKNSVEKE